MFKCYPYLSALCDPVTNYRNLDVHCPHTVSHVTSRCCSYVLTFPHFISSLLSSLASEFWPFLLTPHALRIQTGQIYICAVAQHFSIPQRKPCYLLEILILFVLPYRGLVKSLPRRVGMSCLGSCLSVNEMSHLGIPLDIH